jgi:hypothetical protein
VAEHSINWTTVYSYRTKLSWSKKRREVDRMLREAKEIEIVPER